MNLEPRAFILLLNEFLKDKNNGPTESARLLKSLNDSLSKEEINVAVIDHYLIHFFDKTNGFTYFISSSISNKSFKDSNKYIFEICYTLINNFPEKLDKYVVEIHDLCFKVLKSSLLSSDEKVASINVLILSFTKINKCVEHPDHYTEIYKSLKNTFLIKKCDSVQEKVLIALGTFAQKFQYIVNNNEHELKNLFLAQLENQAIQKEPSYKILNGAFTGLSNYCESFPFDMNIKEDKFVISKIYNHIQKFAVPSSRIKIANRAALTFLSNNINLFVPLMINRYKEWHENLLKWLDLGDEDRKVGFSVLNSFYLSLGTFLFDSKDVAHKDITLYFLHYFKSILKNFKVSNYEIRSVLLGLSSFSKVYQSHLSQEELNDLFILIMQIFEQKYILNEFPSEDSLEYLPNFVEIVARLMHFKKITNSEVFCLQKGVINMFKVFPNLPYSSHFYVVDCLVSTFHSLKVADEKVFNNFMEDTIYQGVVWSCSRNHVSEAEINEDNKDKIITVKHFLYLWRNLLKITSVRKYDKLNIFLQDRKYIVNTLVVNFVRTLFMLINKLNVNIVPTESEYHLTDPQAIYKVVEVNDFAIFLNVVDFYDEIFEQIDPNTMKKCIGKLIQHLISKCITYPFISGFYKLLSCCLKITNKLNYFKKNQLAQDVIVCYESLTQFIQILLDEAKQFKDELLISCLQVLLQCPLVLIKDILQICVPVFITIFHVGKSYIKLADVAVDTLEHWQNQIPSEIFDPFLVQVVPILDSYLQSKSLGGVAQFNTDNRRKTAQALKKRKVILEIEPELLKLQRKILNFIGQQNQDVCRAFVSTDNAIEIAVWGDQEHLKIVLPYGDFKLDLYLDKFVPRIVNLALNCSDRKTRIAASELLHAVIMVFLGTTKQMSQSELSDVNKLFENIALPILKLSCDLDQIVQQLFQPLAFQLIHWYTHKTQLRTDHSAIIIESFLEGITHPTDSALRDFCGKCVNEFVKWTIRQTSERTLAKDPVNIKILVKKMRFYSLHPDPSKKLGAALIFNNIYREIREESALLSIFWFELLHIFVKSLSVVEFDVNNDICITQINMALTHIQRGFLEKNELFNKCDSDRRVPTDIQGNVLKDVSVFLLLNTGSRSSYCREKCMEMFCYITPKTKAFVTFSKFISAHVNPKLNWINETYVSYLIQHPTLSAVSDSSSSDLIRWMQAFLSALDGYTFVVKNNLLTTTVVINEAFTNSLQYFMKYVVLSKMEDALALIANKKWIFTISEKQNFNKQKSQAVIKILQFFNTFLSNPQTSDLVNTFLNHDLWNLVLNVIFNPQDLGFQHFVTFKDDPLMLPLLANFMKKMSPKQSFELCGVLTDYVKINTFANVDLKQQVSRKERNVVNGLILLESCKVKGIDLTSFRANLCNIILSKFIETAENGKIMTSDLQDTTLNHCRSILEFAIQDTEELKVFINFLYQPLKVETLESNGAINFGLYILHLFEDIQIHKILIANFEEFINISVSNESFAEKAIELIVYLLNYINNHKDLRHERDPTCKIIMQKWYYFEKYFEKSSENSAMGIEFVGLILNTSKIKYKEVKKWLVASLIDQKHKLWKNELDFKLTVFHLIVLVLETEDQDDALRCGLRYLKTTFFIEGARVPSEIKIVSFKKLILTVPKMVVPDLLIFLLDVYISVSELQYIDFTKHLTSYIFQNKIDVQQDSLVKIYEMLQSSDYDHLQKYKLLGSAICAYQNCDFKAFEDFFIANISNMILVLRQQTTQQNLIDKIINFVFIELLFLRNPISNSATEISSITLRALGESSNNKKFLLECLKFTLVGCKDSPEVEPNFIDLLRLYKCHCYNAMVSIVSNSVKDANLYTKLFIRQENDSDILWKALIDTEKKYVFGNDFDAIPKRRKVLVNIRDEVRARKIAEKSLSHSVRYIESQRVYNSSLSEDLTKFDFTNTIVRNESDQSPDQEKTKNYQSLVELDCIDVNNHECMATVCGLIEHIFQNQVSTLPSEDEVAYVLPSWLEGIRNLLLDSDTHHNIKIFWIKVIDNEIHIFEHFAKWFVRPLLKFVVDKCAGDSFNYFITDVMAILASWSSQVVLSDEEDINLVSELVTFLIKNLNNERQDIFKYHLELFKLIVESWKTNLRIPYDLIYSKLNTDLKSRRVEIGIHVASILLANKIAPWSEANLKEFCLKLFDVLKTSTLKVTYRPCAETIGLLLRFLKDSPNIEKIVGNVNIVLKKIDHEKYAYALEAIVLHYPQIADDFHLRKLLSRIHAVVPSLRAIYLRIIISRSDFIDRINDFKSEKWDNYIEGNDLEVQLLTLQVVCKCLSTLKQSSYFKNVIKSVCKQRMNSNVLLRTLIYDIAISLCSSCLDDESKSDETFYLCRDVLIHGLVDEDAEIREKVFAFWQSSLNLPNLLCKRFVYIFENLYKSNSENEFLGYTSYFLLDLLKKKEEFTAKLFEHPLEDCDFEEYNLQTNWRMRHLSVLPMFAETLRTDSEDFQPGSNSSFNQLRETQTSLSFALTQSERMRQFSQYTMSETSLFIKTDEDFVNPNMVTISKLYKVKKRRFLKDKAKIQRFFANQEVKKSFKKVEQREDRVKQRENKVTIYRSYRKGDLPDVQITYQALIEPLQALCLQDSEISKILCLSVFKNITTKEKNNGAFVNEVSSTIKNILNSSTQYDRIFIETLLDMILLNKNSIIVDPGLVSNVCQSSGLITMGTLLLEEYIISYDEQPSTSKKSRGTEISAETNYWLQLAKLYREVEDWDVVKSIFLQKLDCEENEKSAILAESEKEWEKAELMYSNLLETEDSPDKKEFYLESCFKCLAHMGKWFNSTHDKNSRDVVNVVQHVVDSDDPWALLWDQSWKQQKLLPWYVRAQTLKTMSDKSYHNFLRDLNNLNAENYEYLQNNFSDDLCMLWLYKEEIETIKQCVNLSVNRFLETWQSINPLYSNLRYNKLLQFRNIIDVNKFTRFYEDVHAFSEKELNELISYWDRTSNENQASILLSEMRVLARRQFIKLLNKKLDSVEDNDLEYFIKELKTTQFKINLSLVDAAVDQGNFYVAKNSMQLLRNSKDKRIYLSLSRIAYLRCTTISNSPRDKFNIMMQASKSLGVLFQHGVESDLKLESHVQLFNNMILMPKIMEDDFSLLTALKEDDSLMNILGNEDFNSSVDLAISAANKLSRYLLNFENELDAKMDFDVSHPSKEYKMVAEAYVKLAYFSKDQDSDFANFMFSVLRAMKYNSSEARQLFPCILMENNMGELNIATFIKETENIPVWMFLGWLPQLLVSIDSPKVKAVAPILIKIAQTYPQSIMYAYRLSKENYRLNDETVREDARAVIAMLDELLASDETIDVFLKALSFVSIPTSTLLYYERKIYKLCADSESMDKIKLALQNIVNQLFDDIPDSRNENALQGNMFKKINKYKTKFKEMMNKSVENILKEIKNIDNELLTSLKSRGEKYSGLLKDYSPWLSHFSSEKLNIELEIPGQYDGKKLPLPQHHVKISGFCPNIAVMQSMRKPIKLTILGNDTREYPFLIKFGEDLRQDQRIQQLFNLMNNIFDNDRSLSQRCSAILTFQVVPLTTSLGMIQWISDTVSLQGFMKKSLKTNEGFRKSTESFENWICKGSRSKTPREIYGDSAIKYSRDQVIAKYRSLVNMIPLDVLRTAFWNLSANTQGFCALRDNFIRSYSILCVAHWILGIGDRHLENSLISQRSGRVLGIDFGHAFGTGTQILPIPELVPFRLTPHIIGLMEPFGEKGAFREIMIHCLRSLRSNKSSLLATMNVFIEEPSLDWLEHASRFEGTSDRRTHDWYPTQKIRQAKRKLEGANSTIIMIEDLQAGHKDQERYMNAYIALVKGHLDHDIRALKTAENLSVEDQVDSIIDHATDYNLLGRMFQGWMGWV